MRLVLTVLLGAGVAGCGAQVVLEDDGAGGSGTSGTSTSSSKATSGATATNVSSSTGIGPCDSHDDCAPNVCHFPTGTCVPTCQPGSCDSCGPGSFCESCAIGSCPDCRDCVAACVPKTEGRCDDDDPCPPGGGVCYFPGGVCMQACDLALPNGGCGDFEFCDGCATASCCVCKNCIAVCIGGE